MLYEGDQPETRGKQAIQYLESTGRHTFLTFIHSHSLDTGCNCWGLVPIKDSASVCYWLCNVFSLSVWWASIISGVLPDLLYVSQGLSWYRLWIQRLHRKVGGARIPESATLGRLCNPSWLFSFHLNEKQGYVNPYLGKLLPRLNASCKTS